MTKHIESNTKWKARYELRRWVGIKRWWKKMVFRRWLRKRAVEAERVRILLITIDTLEKDEVAAKALAKPEANQLVRDSTVPDK